MTALDSLDRLRFTTHAIVRCQQRSFSDAAVSSVLLHGKMYNAGDGAKAYFLGKRAVADARRKHGLNLDRWQDTAVIVSRDDAIVTVQRVERPKRSWRGRH